MSIRLLSALAVLAVVACGRAGYPPPALLPAVTGAGSAIVIDGTSGRLLQRLPAGVASPDAKRLYWVDGQGLHAAETATGGAVRDVAVPAGFGLPPVSIEGALGGLSPLGERLVLVQHWPGHSNFWVYDTRSLLTPPRKVDLAGDFEFDAITDTGNNWLYLIERKEQAGAGRYSVTVYDLAQGRLCGCTVVDKTEPGTSLMRGTRIASVPAQGGGAAVFSLYVGGGKDGVFIHALSLDGPFAWCVDLPGTGAVPAAAAADWSLALAPGGRTLYAINPAAGVAVAVDSSRGAADKPPVRKVQRFAPDPGAAAAGRGAAVSPDGRTLFVIGGGGVAEFDTATLQPGGLRLAGAQPRSIAVSPDGKWLYAVTAAGDVVRLDPREATPQPVATGLERPMVVVTAK